MSISESDRQQVRRELAASDRKLVQAECTGCGRQAGWYNTLTLPVVGQTFSGLCSDCGVNRTWRIVLVQLAMEEL